MNEYILFFICRGGGRRGRDHMVVGFTTAYAISADFLAVVIIL
jgi:hypothetical protein